MGETASYIPLLVAVTCFLTLFLLFWSGYQYFQRVSEKRRLLERTRDPLEVMELLSDEGEKTKKAGKFLGSSLRVMDSIGKRVVKEESADYSKMKVKFARAGLRGANVSRIFWGTKGLLLLLPFALWPFVGFLPKNTFPIHPLIILFMCSFLGFYAPDIWLGFKRRSREETLFQGFPDALDLLVVCVEAGMAMDAAIYRVAREIALSNLALSDEFKLYNLELRAGLTRQDAMERMAQRIDIEDVYALISLLIQTDKFGTSLASALRIYSESFRRRRYMRAEEKAAKLPPKMTFPMIGLIFPALIVFTAGPAFLSLLKALDSTVAGR